MSLYYLHISDFLDVFDSLDLIDSVIFKSENQKHRSNLHELVVIGNYTTWSLFETLKSHCIVCAANTSVHFLKILRILLWYSKIRKFRFQRGLCSALVRGSARNTFCWHWPLAAFGLNAARVAICQTWLSWLVTITQHAMNDEEDENDEDQNFEKRLRKKGQKMMT